MKKMKKTAAMLMAATVAMAMPMTAMAATITVEHAVNGATYSAYRVLDYTKGDGGAYSYTITTTSDWYSFVSAHPKWFALTPVAADDQKFTVSATGNLASTDKSTQETAARELATKMKEFVEANKLTSENFVKAEGDSATFDINDLGYYFIDTSTGTICALINSSDDATVNEKNTLPTLEKTIINIEKDEGDNYTQRIGEEVKYSLTVNKGTGTINDIIVHDKMNANLNFNNNIVVKQGETPLTEGTEYEVTTPGTETAAGDKCTFEVTLLAEYVKGLADNEEVTIEYTATVLDTAVSAEAMENKAHLQYLEATTPEQQVDVYEYQFNLKKVIGGTTTILSGAEFELRDKEGTPLSFIAEKKDSTDANRITGYYVVPERTSGATTTIVAGDIVIRGLNNGTYSLVETKAPEGYNLAEEPTEVIIANDNGTDTVIANNAGTILPSTGGIGTTVFYAAGIVVMAGAVFFVVRSRKHD